MKTSLGCGLALLAGSSAPAATLIADYQFHSSYASAVPGAPDLTPINSVSFTTATINGQLTDVAAFAQGSGLRLETPVSLSAGYSVIVQVALDQTSGYAKLMDFKDRADDPGLYNNSTQLNFYPVASGINPVIAPLTFAQIALTRDASGRVAAYVNGVQQFNFADTSNFAVLATSAFNLFVDDLHTGGNEASPGRVARVRLYSGALSATEIVALTGDCYANCDGSTTAPLLNVLDFSCFINAFAAGDPYANCDHSSTPPYLNVLDFACFINRFAAGCS
jgi:hypothetical protein